MLGLNLRSEPQMCVCVDRSPGNHKGLLICLTRRFSELTAAYAKPREQAWHAGGSLSPIWSCHWRDVIPGRFSRILSRTCVLPRVLVVYTSVTCRNAAHIFSAPTRCQTLQTRW